MDSKPITEIAAWLSLYIFVGMTIVELTLAVGAPFGILAWGGKYEVLPWRLRFASFIIAVLLVTAAISMLEKANMVSVIKSPDLVAYLLWFFVVFFAFATYMNYISKSAIERRIIMPIAFLTFIFTLIVAIGL